MQEEKIWKKLIFKGVLIVSCIIIFSGAGIFLEKAREAIRFSSFFSMILLFLIGFIFIFMFFEEKLWQNINLEEKEGYPYFIPAGIGIILLAFGAYLLNNLWSQLIISQV